MQEQNTNRRPNHFHGEYKNPNLPYENGVRPLINISKVLKYGLIFFIPLAALEAALTAFPLMNAAGYASFLADISANNRAVLNALIASSLVYRLVYLFCIVMTSWFLFRATRNLNTVTPDQIRTSPHFAWLWFFIPFANFYKPYQTVSDIDRVTKTTIGVGKTSNSLIMTWWVIFIASVFIGATDIRLPVPNWYKVDLALDVISGILAIAAAILFIRVTREITRNQQHLGQAGIAHVFD